MASLMYLMSLSRYICEGVGVCFAIEMDLWLAHHCAGLVKFYEYKFGLSRNNAPHFIVRINRKRWVNCFHITS